MKIDKKLFKAGGLLGVFVVGVVAGIFVLSNISNPLVYSDSEIKGMMEERYFRHIVGDADPGAGNSGFMYFMVYPHSADPGTDYASNLSNATAYEYSDSTNTELTGETPYDTAFDFVMKFRVNTTVGYNTSSSSWMDSWVRANITCDFDYATDIGANTSMTVIQIGNNSNYAWYHAYILDHDGGAGSGFTITKDESFNVSLVTMDGYY